MQAVKRISSILKNIGNEQYGMSLTDIAASTNIPVATAHRILQALVSEGLIGVTTDDGLYIPGEQLLKISFTPQAGLLREFGRGVLAEISQETSETSFITQLIGGSAMCVVISEGTRAVRLFVSQGQKLPLHSAASSRCLLAGLPESQVRHMVTDNVIDSPRSPLVRNIDELIERLKLVHDRGYEISVGELDDFAWAVAAPILDTAGNWIASLTITTPMPLTKLGGYTEKLVQLARQRAKDISVRFNCPGHLLETIYG